MAGRTWSNRAFKQGLSWTNTLGNAIRGGLAVIAESGSRLEMEIRKRLVLQAYAELRRRRERAFRNAEAHGVREWVLEYFHL
jgi:hypothetical protein